MIWLALYIVFAVTFGYTAAWQSYHDRGFMANGPKYAGRIGYALKWWVAGAVFAPLLVLLLTIGGTLDWWDAYKKRPRDGKIGAGIAKVLFPTSKKS